MKIFIRFLVILAFIIGFDGCSGAGESASNYGGGYNYACTFETEALSYPYDWKPVCIDIDNEDVCKKYARGYSTYRNIKWNPGYVCKY